MKINYLSSLSFPTSQVIINPIDITTVQVWNSIFVFSPLTITYYKVFFFFLTLPKILFSFFAAYFFNLQLLPVLIIEWSLSRHYFQVFHNCNGDSILHYCLDNSPCYSFFCLTHKWKTWMVHSLIFQTKACYHSVIKNLTIRKSPTYCMAHKYYFFASPINLNLVDKEVKNKNCSFC